LRQNRGWTQPQLAEQLGVSVKTITYYERSAQNPTSKTLDRIAEILGVEPSELIRAADQQTRKSKSGPPSRLHLLFDQVSGLPRGKQKIVTDLLEGYLEKSAK
jgi:transcriptional regulator with XRE-family HTH domain